MSSPVMEALRVLHERRVAEGKPPPHEANDDHWLDPAHPLTPEEIRLLANALYDYLRREMRIERERHRGF